jgi:F0F1-type ATP synthase assembly protein I
MDRRLIALRLLGLGWYVAICIVVGAVGGVWLDRLSGLTPLFTLLGVLFGTVAAFYGLYKMVIPLFNNDSTSGRSGSEGDTSL